MPARSERHLAATALFWGAELGMGIQFISFPMEVPGRREQIGELLRVPPKFELMAVYRLGYLPEKQRRPAIDWSSPLRRRISQFVFRETVDNPQQGWDDDPDSMATPEPSRR